MKHDKPLTLYELNLQVRELIETTLDSTYWVKAELSEVRLSGKGHCFLELIQRSTSGNTPIAKARGVIMAVDYPLLKLDFEETTGQVFSAGIEVLMEVHPRFSEVYGYSLIITDIDPTFTLGDMAKRRREIMARLEAEGIAAMNKELELPPVVSRIAVISSPTAAGYGDFRHQIETDGAPYNFTFRLFPAVMQGEQTEKTVIAALDKIAGESRRWDAVVIIRGGGAVSDLVGFETYALACNCAQFPLPVITGIGHERDMTVLDLVAHTHLKTPTAVAAFLITKMADAAATLHNLSDRIKDRTVEALNEENRRLERIVFVIHQFSRNFCMNGETQLGRLMENIHRMTKHLLNIAELQLNQQDKRLKQAVINLIHDERQRLELMQQQVSMNDPMRILRLGYSITLRNGKAVRRPSDVKAGDVIETKLSEGTIKSKVE